MTVGGIISDGNRYSEYLNKKITKLDGKYTEGVQIPAKAFFCRQHLAALATPTILRPASSEFPDGAILNKRRFTEFVDR